MKHPQLDCIFAILLLLAPLADAGKAPGTRDPSAALMQLIATREVDGK